MPSQGPRSPSTVVDDAGVGTAVWLGPEGAGTSDDVRAVASVTEGEISHYLKATGFGFSLPSGATVLGILGEIEHGKSGTNIRDTRVRIIKGGVIGVTEKALTPLWSGADSYVSYGGSTDLWGETWAAGDINGLGFGIALAVQEVGGETASARVDHMRLTVFYTGGGAREDFIPGTHFGGRVAETVDFIPGNFMTFRRRAPEIAAMASLPGTSSEPTGTPWEREKERDPAEDWLSHGREFGI